MHRILAALRAVPNSARAGIASVVASVAVFMLIGVAQAQAAADSVTGIDYQADIADPVLASARPAIVAGVLILVTITAVVLFKKFWKRVTS